MRCLYEPDTFEDEIYRRLYTMRHNSIFVHNQQEADAFLAMGVQKSDIAYLKPADIKLQTLIAKLKKMLVDNTFKTPSGAVLTIDELEAFTVIDIDSGTFTGDQTKDDFAYELNLEAAESIRKLLLLRQISGVIIIDFVHMPNTLQLKFLEKCRELFFTREDDFSIHGFTALGLLELSRKREKPSLKASMSFDYRRGDLYYLALMTIESDLERLSHHTNTKRVMITCEEPLYIYLRQYPLDGATYGMTIKYEKQKMNGENFSIQTMPES
jgi:ribonuclease G